jgi:hypothetical protein
MSRNVKYDVYIKVLKDHFAKNSLLEEFGYENHPQEIEASDITKYYYKECIEYLKSLGCLK